MGKIYEGENKLSVVQVCDKLRNEITTEQARVISSHIPNYYGDKGLQLSEKSAFAHAVLDAYKDMPSTTENDMLVKKLAKHLMEKYMKSSTAITESEGIAFRALIDDIMKKGNQ